MNPSGYRMEEKKEADPYRGSTSREYNYQPSDSKSTHSYKSNHSTRSSVLERAREYNRRIDEQNNNRRSKSLERGSQGEDTDDATSDANRSHSAGRSPQNQGGNSMSTRERAMASVRKDSARANVNHSNSLRASQQQQQQQRVNTSVRTAGPDPQTSPASTAFSRRTERSQARTATTATNNNNNRRGVATANTSKAAPHQAVNKPQPKPQAIPQQQEGEGGNAVVTPELLVDALSGHEDGLLAIAEKLMEHYDAGYDVMGEAIIDAFADVQKLFQHVVEAAHMEGAAFEASRRQAEMAEQHGHDTDGPGAIPNDNDMAASPQNAHNGGRHDEFVDQDVKDVLTEAIKKGNTLKDASQQEECYRMYEQACQSASALLPVDSDHRGRLQLSLARAESMGPDRACAILRYAMDDVLRSGMRAGRTALPDPSKRADVVLNRNGPAVISQSPDEALASLTEEMKEIMTAPVYNDTPLQSVATRFWTALQEAQKSQQKNADRLEQMLAKLKGEFLLARAEWEEKLNQSNEKAETYKEKYERLKERFHNRAAADRHGESTSATGEDYMDQARSNYYSNSTNSSFQERFDSIRSQTSRAGSVASLGSGIAIHAKKLVNSINDFNCNSEQAANSQVRDETVEDLRRMGKSPRNKVHTTTPSRSTHTANSSRTPASITPSTSNSRSFREYSKSPKRMDV